MNTPRKDALAAVAPAQPRAARLAGSPAGLGLSVTVLLGIVAFGAMSAHAQGYGTQGRGGEMSNLLHAYFPVARPTAGNATVNRRQASDLVRAASGGSVDVISVRTQGDVHYVKVLTHDRPPRMQTYKVDAKTGKVWR